jgi:putative spermidine/putrescine transport system ATP-binding protein
VVSIRPEHLIPDLRIAAGAMSGTIKTVLPLGPQVVYDVELTGGRGVKVIVARDSTVDLLQPGITIHLRPLSAAHCRVFAA